MKTSNKKITIFEDKEIRRTWHNDKWFFVVEDVVQVLVDSKNIKDYINKMRKRDLELDKGYGQFVHTLDIQTKGGYQKINCADIQGIFRIIQSIPSPRAEPFKLWLARIGRERLEEIADPELAVTRAKDLYQKKGYDKNWIDKRMRGIAVRNTLTDEWKNRGAKGSHYAILTDEIYKATFDKTAKEYMDFKSLDKKEGDNLRDHMGDIELILTMLGEATTTELSTTKNSQGIIALKNDAKTGGEVAGRTRKDIEEKTGKTILSSNNFKKKRKNIKGK
jgi:prophage antirepressor-like protein